MYEKILVAFYIIRHIIMKAACSFKEDHNQVHKINNSQR
jgi:hypothetical protein